MKGLLLWLGTCLLECFWNVRIIFCILDASSVQFSRSIVSDSLWPHGLQYARLPCPSPTPRAYSNSCPLSRWCHPSISSSVVPFSSHVQSFPASGFFQMSQFFASVLMQKYWSFTIQNTVLQNTILACLDSLCKRCSLWSLVDWLL